LALALGLAPTATAAEEQGSLHDLIVVLKDRGVIDEGDYESIAARNAAYEAKQAEDRKPALSFWGDFRFRSEHFWYDDDETGFDRTNRHRARYRFRLNGKAEVNDHAMVLVRFVSGSDDNRSTNQTLGSALDFDTDDFRIDRAYARLSPFAHGKVGENGSLFLELGKTGNPYTWKRGKDFMLWDGDISLEGGTVQLGWELAEGFETFANGGYYIIDENSTSKDPHLWAGQIGFHADPGASVSFGARGTYYHFDSLDAAFHARGVDGTGGITSAGGNIVDGLSGGEGGQNVQVIEGSLYLGLLEDTDWPVLFYASYANNLTAEDSVPTTAHQEDTAWGAGVEVGDKGKFVKLGVGYWHIEANAFPSQFIDSDLFDGRTNREGWAAYLSRSVWKNTDLNLTAFWSDEIENDLPAFADSVPNAERVRLQADLVFKFK
jgi:hypothetical protein